MCICVYVCGAERLCEWLQWRTLSETKKRRDEKFADGWVVAFPSIEGCRCAIPEGDAVFASNFIGIVFCRSLHFQFYCWYYHAVPYLLFQNEHVPVLGKLMLFAGLEFTWSYCLDPVEGTSTPLSSIVLQTTHALMLISLWYSKPVEHGVVVVAKEESAKSMGSNKKKLCFVESPP